MALRTYQPASFIFVIFLVISCNFAFAASVTTFTDGFTNPSGLAVNPIARKLYVNAGTSGNLWAVEINDDGSAGSTSVITSSFPPKLDLALDVTMNIYGIDHGDDYIFRIDSTGNVSQRRPSSYGYGTGIAIEEPGLSSNQLFFTQVNGYLYGAYISDYDSSDTSLPFNRINDTDRSIRFMEWKNGYNEIIATTGTKAVIINPTNGACTDLVTGLISPHGIAQDSAGNIYIADTSAGTITQISTLGLISTIASGLSAPIGLAFDDETNQLFVAENTSGRISSINMTSDDVCPPVVTFARNPVTQEWAAFPSPCDVPLRWQVSSTDPSWYDGSYGFSPSITINPDLSFTIPSATYNSLTGPMDLNLEFNFFSDEAGTLLWRLNNLIIN